MTGVWFVIGMLIGGVVGVSIMCCFQINKDKLMKKTYKILGKRGRITIPYEIRKSVGFAQNDVLSFEQGKDNRSVVVRREKICDCQDKEKNANKEEITLYEFLNNLTPAQQRAALVHLSVKWAQKGVMEEEERISL